MSLMITLAAVVSYTTPEHVTKWGPRIALTLIVLIIIGLAVWGMSRGWKNKARRQHEIAAPAAVPTTEAALLGGPTEGTYLASTTAGQWLDRIVVHSLGVPSRATVSVRSDGVAVEREGEPAFFIARPDLRAVRLDRGIAGEVYEAGSVLIITWALGDVVLDSGFRAQQTAAQVPLATAVRALLDTTSGSTPTATPTEGAS